MSDPGTRGRRDGGLEGAIYIDFEALKTDPPRPALLGVLIGSEGEDLEQLIVDERLAPAQRANPKRTRAQSLHDAVDAIVNFARINDTRIVAWSTFDRDRMIEARPDLEAEIRARYFNALEIARKWRQHVHPDFTIEREGRFSPKHTLDQYARLAKYPHAHRLQNAKPAYWIRHVLKGLAANDGRYRRITPQAKRDWWRTLEYNRHDLLALRHIALAAVRELGLWRAYERTTFCVDDDRRRISFRAGSRSARLDALLARRDAARWALITAWNPGSQSLSDPENAHRHEELRAAVAALGHYSLEGEGNGLFVLGISRADALRLGRHFGQLAIVIGRRGEPPTLTPTA